MCSTEADRPSPDIEITEEMIEAGRDALFRIGPIGGFPNDPTNREQRELAIKVYSAMVSARQASA